jgi:hypothetical protein
MEASARFTAFVEIYRDKIRKKIRLARQPESALDLLSELEIASRLLGDQRLAVAYEPYANRKSRGPDFAVAYRANLGFNIEVARIRGGMGAGDGPSPELARIEERILRILLDKLGQMQPGMANLLMIRTSQEVARSIDLGRLMQGIKSRAEGKDPAFYAASRFTTPAEFYKEYLRLSGILLWSGPSASLPPVLWVNKQARPGLAENVLRIVARALEDRTLSSGGR